MYEYKTLYIVKCFILLAHADYWEDRAKLIKQEESRILGASIVLSDKEQVVNKILMDYKLNEYDAGFKQPGIFAPGRHFFESRVDIEKSKVFKFIKKVPKGGALHGHDGGLVSEDFLYKLTFKENLYACTVNNRLQLRFMARSNHSIITTSHHDRGCKWRRISSLRRHSLSYDGWLRSQLTLYRKNPREAYQDINQVWKAFEALFDTTGPLIFYRPVFVEYFYQYFKELYEDNVMYAEIRCTLDPVYELDGFTYTPVEVIGIYADVLKKFKHDYPGFWGARFIYAPLRSVTNSTMSDYIKSLKAIGAKHPDILAGFDLVGQEDLGRPLSEFVQQLLQIKDEYNFFFHAGETNWYGTSTDFNLVDAILLGTKRIGHGYALVKHPQLLEIIKEKDIAIEVCPISNQVLMLVEDMRNHPANSLMADGYPVVISADDPSFWGAKALSYDFYMAFMGMASRNADLRLLKQLAINSLKYSAMHKDEKLLALKTWEKKWDEFIESVIEATHYDVVTVSLL